MRDRALASDAHARRLGEDLERLVGEPGAPPVVERSHDPLAQPDLLERAPDLGRDIGMEL